MIKHHSEEKRCENTSEINVKMLFDVEPGHLETRYLALSVCFFFFSEVSTTHLCARLYSSFIAHSGVSSNSSYKFSVQWLHVLFPLLRASWLTAKAC